MVGYWRHEQICIGAGSGDVGTNGGEDTEPMLANVDLVNEEPVLATESSTAPHSNPTIVGPTLFIWLA